MRLTYASAKAWDAVSIHAPVWGATLAHVCYYHRQHCFNPRTRVGCDNAREHTARHLYVSIHAPVWGATALKCRFHTQLKFQSTHPCGVRQKNDGVFVDQKVSIHAPVWGATLAAKDAEIDALFQSTHPCGVRLGVIYRIKCKLGFNPRTRVGCDHLPLRW